MVTQNYTSLIPEGGVAVETGKCGFAVDAKQVDRPAKLKRNRAVVATTFLICQLLATPKIIHNRPAIGKRSPFWV
jgi:hypothetical protein